MKINCLNCSAEFSVLPYRAKTAKFCGQKCRARYFAKNPTPAIVETQKKWNEAGRKKAHSLPRSEKQIAAAKKSWLERSQKGNVAHTTLTDTPHGLSGHQSYGRWVQMMSRCYNENSSGYSNYGGRGIKVYEEWHDLRIFLAWLDENLGKCPEGYSMDRIDNDGNYEPGNIRWSSYSDQNRNSRRALR